MVKEIAELSFDDLVKKGVELELNAIVKSESLHSRVFQIMDLAARWRYEQSRAEKTKAPEVSLKPAKPGYVNPIKI